MIVGVAEIGSHCGRHAIVVVSQQAGEQLARGPDRAAQVQEVALEHVDVVDQARTGASERRALEHLERVGKLFEHVEVVVDDQVDDGVGEVVGAQGPGAPLAGREAIAQSAEHVARPLLEGDDDRAGENERELLVVECGEPRRGRSARERLRGSG